MSHFIGNLLAGFGIKPSAAFQRILDDPLAHGITPEHAQSVLQDVRTPPRELYLATRLVTRTPAAEGVMPYIARLYREWACQNVHYFQNDVLRHFNLGILVEGMRSFLVTSDAKQWLLTLPTSLEFFSLPEYKDRLFVIGGTLGDGYWTDECLAVSRSGDSGETRLEGREDYEPIEYLSDLGAFVGRDILGQSYLIDPLTAKPAHEHPLRRISRDRDTFVECYLPIGGWAPPNRPLNFKAGSIFEKGAWHARVEHVWTFDLEDMISLQAQHDEKEAPRRRAKAEEDQRRRLVDRSIRYSNRKGSRVRCPRTKESIEQGALLRTKRESRNWTASDVVRRLMSITGEKFSLSTVRAYLSRIENGYNPSEEILRALERLYESA